jgi:hypothetical protein
VKRREKKQVEDKQEERKKDSQIVSGGTCFKSYTAGVLHHNIQQQP